MATDSTVHLFVRFATGGATDTLAAALAECGAKSRAEDEGCLEYRTYRGADGEALFVTEAWTSQAALDAHAGAPHTRVFNEAIEKATGKTPREIAQFWAATPLD